MLVMMTSPAFAGISATAVLTGQHDADGINYDYQIQVTNSPSSTDVIGTFWFSWMPGNNFMQHAPVSTTSPTGWGALVTHAPNQGFAIQWIAANTADRIPIGGTETFSFVSAETPAELAGLTPFATNVPELTAVIYNARPFSELSDTIEVRITTPEPATLSVGLLGGLGALVYNRVRRFGRK